VRILAGERPFPIHFVLGLTTRCNHDCLWCSGYGSETRETHQIDLEKLLDRLREGATMGLKAATYVGRGEPLLYPHFSRLVEEVSRIGLEQACFTNGSLLRQYGDEILTHFLWIRVSLDAASATQHERLHRVVGEFERIVDSIAYIVTSRNGRKLPTVGVQFGLHQRSVGELYKAAVLVRDLGADYLSIKPIYNRGQVGIQIENNTLESSEIEEEIQRTAALGDNGFHVYYKPFQFHLMNRPDTFSREYGTCYGPHFEWHIAEDGSALACGPMRRRIGNIYEMSLSELLDSARYRQILTEIDVQECYKGCRVHSLNEILWGVENPDETFHINFI
jgi:MoaA/NifB/PqqE/SkfB family radical SAM enzyme